MDGPRGEPVVIRVTRFARRLAFFSAAAVLALSWPSGAAYASVVATIDRADVELNESFTLDVTVDSAIDVEPNVAALEKDFYILSRSELRNTTIVNGQINRTRTWTYVLMAKQAGDFIIPPVLVGNEQSKPLTVTIAPVRAALPGQSDIFVVAEADHRETFVQAQVLYKVKVYRAVATRQPRLSEPDISGVDVLVELAAQERSYDSLIDGKNYNVVERVYALFPQASGELAIAPALFEARVLRDGRITGRKIFKSDPVEIEVKPIPPPPADFPDAAWFPASRVELAEEWSREPDSLPAGEPITRRITVSALGQLSTQIPVIEPVESDGIKVYPDKPELHVNAVPGGIQATRKDQYAMIAVEPGDVRLPALSLPWWNVGTGEWQVATLPARTVHIEISADALPPVAAAAAAHDAGSGTVLVHSNFWRHVSEGLVGLWLATLIVWWWSRRESALSAGREPKAPPVQRRKAAFMRAARQAAGRSDADTVKSSLLSWGRLQWPDNPPRSMREISARVPEPLSGELRRLCESSYGPGRGAWKGAGLAAALRSFKAEAEDRAGRSAEPLPPLMPQT